MCSERFTVRWCRRAGFRAGYAVYDCERPITISFQTRHEAERKRDNIAVLYEKLGFGSQEESEMSAGMSKATARTEQPKTTKKPRKGWCPVDKVCSLDCQNGCEKFDQKAFNERWRWA